MKRINTATAVNGKFVDGDRTLGKKATQFSAEWCNAIQEELCAIVESITGEAVTGESTHEVIDALNGNRVFMSIAVGSAVLRIVEGTGPTMGGLAALSAGTIEATAKLKVGGAELVPGNGQPSLAGLYGVEAGNVGTTNLQADTLDSHGEGVTALQVLKKLVGNQGQSAQSNALALGATRADSLVVDGDAEVSGDLTVDGDLSIVGAFVADGGFATNDGDIKSTNGEVSGSTVTATNKLTLGTALRFAINDSSGHGVGDAETWVANTAPQDSLLCVINDNNDSVVMWGGEGRQTFIMGHSALLIMKIRTGVYPVTAQLNYS